MFRIWTGKHLGPKIPYESLSLLLEAEPWRSDNPDEVLFYDAS